MVKARAAALALAAAAAPLAAVSVEGFVWNSSPSTDADTREASTGDVDLGDLWAAILGVAALPDHSPEPPSQGYGTEDGEGDNFLTNLLNDWIGGDSDSDSDSMWGFEWLFGDPLDEEADAEGDSLVEAKVAKTSFIWKQDKKYHLDDGRDTHDKDDDEREREHDDDRHDKKDKKWRKHDDDDEREHDDDHHDKKDKKWWKHGKKDKKWKDWYSSPYDYEAVPHWEDSSMWWYGYSSYPYSYSYPYDDFNFGLTGGLFGELDAELNAAMADFTDLLAGLGVSVDDTDKEHDHTQEALSRLTDRLAEAEERIAQLEEAGEANAFVKEWLADDAAMMNELYEEGEHGDATHAMGMEYPFGINGAGIPWVGLEAGETADGGNVPALLSVDFESALGVEHEHLNGVFSSCVQRGANGGVAGMFSSAMSAIANSTGVGIFDLMGSRIADALDSIDLECALFGIVDSTGDVAGDLQASLNALTTFMSSPLPKAHVPHPCQHPTERPTHGHRTCLEEGEHIETLGGFGVHVESGAVALGSTVKVPVEIVDETTGAIFTIYVTVSAQDATAVSFNKPKGKDAHRHRFPNDEGEPESMRDEHDHDDQDLALIGMCLGGAALLVSLVAAGVLLRRRRVAATGGVSSVAIVAPTRTGASGSSTTKADLPDSAVIVAMPADLAATDAVVAEVVAVPSVV